MKENYIYLTEDERKSLDNYMSLPEEERRFFRLLIRIGGAHILSDEDYHFFMHYIWKQDIKRIEAVEELERLSKENDS